MTPSQRRAKKKPRLIVGVMSGTSADGIDVALVRCEEAALHGASALPPRLENFASLPFPKLLRAAVLRIAEGAPTTSGELSQLNFALGHTFAQAVLRACRQFRIRPRDVNLIGSHGQTIYHQGNPSRVWRTRVASTLQIGEPAVIAAVTGITTVGDFRPADMAAGGQGAPLVPFVDYLLYRHLTHGRVALNIGGIANVTVIPRRAKLEDVFAFDTGPGNMPIDGLIRHFTKGRQSYDRGARTASRGNLLPALLARLLADPYFRKAPPKTAGREQYGQAFVERLLDWGRRHRTQPADLVRTATVFTARSVADAVQRHVLPRSRVTQLIVSGGGVRNPLLMSELSAALPGIQTVSSDSVGVPSDAKEAFAFALLASETIHNRPGNLPSATGAASYTILGKICHAPLP